MVLSVIAALAALLAGLVLGIALGRFGARHELGEAYELLTAVGYDNAKLREMLARELRS